jgi:hypothetical protein
LRKWFRVTLPVVWPESRSNREGPPPPAEVGSTLQSRINQQATMTEIQVSFDEETLREVCLAIFSFFSFSFVF